MPLSPQQQLFADAKTLPLCAFLLWPHAKWKVVVGDVDVAGVVSFVGIILAAFTVSPCVRLVPVVGADRHSYQPQRAQRQKQTCHG